MDPDKNVHRSFSDSNETVVLVRSVTPGIRDATTKIRKRSSSFTAIPIPGFPSLCSSTHPIEMNKEADNLLRPLSQTPSKHQSVNAKIEAVSPKKGLFSSTRSTSKKSRSLNPSQIESHPIY